jgi:pilus assembly protein Flp/PilA
MRESGPERRVGPFEAGVTNSEPGGTLMTWLTRDAKKFLRDERGVSMVEYGLLLGLITIVCVAAITLLGTAINSLFGTAASSI